MEIDRSNPAGLAQLRGGAQVVRVGAFAFIAGQVSQDDKGNVVGQGDIDAQLTQVFTNLRMATAAVGGSLRSLIKTTTFITSSDYYAPVRNYRIKEYGDHAPANSTVIVSALARPEFMVEIEGIAYVEQAS